MMGSLRFFSLIAALGGVLGAGQVCDLVFDQCPGRFGAGILTVPPGVISLDPRLPVCPENIQVQTGVQGQVPSIVFVIDNSGSMSKGDVDNSSGGNDPDEARFRVVKDMLDTIARVSPSTEVGLVLFTRRLQFDDRDNPLFKRVFADTAQHDAFVPLTPLDKDFGGGVKGVDTLKALLKYTGNGNLVYATRYPDARANSHYDPTSIRDGTDISLGFEAAKAAVRDAKAAKQDQYVIFLSDGEPGDVDDSREADKNEFQAGKGVPTTFTVFFKGNSDNPKVPKTIQTMTDSIRANGYSFSNPKSAYWALNQPGVQLSDLLRNSVLNPIFTSTAGKPASAVLTAAGARYPAVSVDGEDFDFGKRVPLSADETKVELVYTYAYADSGQTKTKDVRYTLTVKRSADGAGLPAGTSSACREQGDIALYGGGAAVSRVTAEQTDLEVRLALGSGESCDGCRVEVKPSQSGDRESVALAAADGYNRGTFRRGISASPLPGNGTLEHLASDSIVVTYVNPDNPLDVIRKAFPYSDLVSHVELIRHNSVSRGGDGTRADPGRTFVLVGPAGFSPTPAAGRNWTIVPAIASTRDSLRYVGEIIEASQSFRAEASIFSNFGQFVNRLSLTVPPSEFATLPPGIRNGTRRLGILWDGRADDGRPVGTGAYIMQTKVTLLPVPGVTGGQAEGRDYRILGVLRER